ncbi:MAG: TnsD family transposase [Tildeniella nuda ZEHNDER 1965/U140]|jgi:hypothetical protein|nr:TnsD family transposase [Tildeniella nuda ZEHNDER 1965/U140]
MGYLILNIKPYPDELLCSIIARYHIRTGNESFSRTHKEFFGKSSQQTRDFFLPCDIGDFVSNLYLKKYTVDGIIQNHTLYPFYKAFLTDAEAWQVRRSMGGVQNRSISELARISLIEEAYFRKFLRFCPNCLQNHLEQYGESYWNRLHNIPGISVCLVHGSHLLDSKIKIQTQKIEYQAASLENCVFSDRVSSYREETLQALLSFAKDTQFIMNQSFVFKGFSWLRKKYKAYLVEKGYLRFSRMGEANFDAQKFAEDFTSYYGHDFLESTHLSLSNKPEVYLSLCLLACDIQPAIDRIAHILLIKFLVPSITDFISDA